LVKPKFEDALLEAIDERLGLLAEPTKSLYQKAGLAEKTSLVQLDFAKSLLAVKKELEC
jgi:hypothetical protein